MRVNVCNDSLIFLFVRKEERSMDIRDYFKKHGKQFLKSAAAYSKYKSVEKTKPTVNKIEDIPKVPAMETKNDKTADKKDRLRKGIYKSFQAAYI